MSGYEYLTWPELERKEDSFRLVRWKIWQEYPRGLDKLREPEGFLLSDD
jgi:hypothetical protein